MMRTGLPIVSDQENEYEKEQIQIDVVLQKRNKRRTKLFYDCFPLVMRNWDLFRKNPGLYKVSIDFMKFGGSDFLDDDVFAKPMLGGFVRAWRSPSFRQICPHCHGEAYFMPFYSFPIMRFTLEDIMSGKSLPQTRYLYCPNCKKEIMRDEKLSDFDRDWIRFTQIVRTSNREVPSSKSGMLFERAMQRLLSYERDKRPPQKKPFTAKTSLHELNNLLWEDEPYNLEAMTDEELVRLVTLYRKMSFTRDADTNPKGRSRNDLLEIIASFEAQWR